MDLKELIKKIEEDARFCGQIFYNADRSSLDISSKEGQNNFVTKYDKMVQEEIKKRLAVTFPDAVFVGEEEAEHAPVDKGWVFVVDPIDGTANFIRDFHMSCISIALLKDGDPVLGVIYNPYAEEMFTAIKGEGAFLNGEPIHVSDKELSGGFIIFGSASYYDDIRDKSYEILSRYEKKALDTRRSGSAALDMCAVACGRAEMFFELRLCPWDYAAAGLLVKEAGGAAHRIEGGDLTYDRNCSVFAANALCKDEWKNMV